MIKTIAATALAITALTATTASAFTCKNTIERIDGKVVYTFSQCTGQEPASQFVLDMMTDSANDRGPDEDE
jgi:hypothetical protein